MILCGPDRPHTFQIVDGGGIRPRYLGTCSSGNKEFVILLYSPYE